MRSQPALRAGDERGTTLVELMVTMVILSIVSTVAFASLASVTKSSADVESRSLSIQDTRTAIERVVREVRSADPIEPVESVGAYATEVSFLVSCSPAGTGVCGADGKRTIGYRVVDNRLERVEGTFVSTIVGPDGGTSLSDAEQRGAVVNPIGHPIFRYFDARGDEVTAAFPDCVKVIQISLVVRSVSGSTSTVELTTTGTLRNHDVVSTCG